MTSKNNFRDRYYPFGGMRVTFIAIQNLSVLQKK